MALERRLFRKFSEYGRGTLYKLHLSRQTTISDEHNVKGTPQRMNGIKNLVIPLDSTGSSNIFSLNTLIRRTILLS